MPRLGQTWYGDQTPNASDYGVSERMEGTECEFRDSDPTVTGKPGQQRSNRVRRAIFVRNTSGGALLPGQTLKWEAGFRGRRVDAVAGDQGEAAGVVDDFLPAAGVQDDDLFWLIVDGPVLARKASSGALAADTVVIAKGSGNIGAVTAAGSDAGVQATCLNACGRVIATGADGATRVLIDFKKSV